MSEMKKEPLVSIIVITYNSAKYVIETLESAKAQTYKNLELIISDDFSSDNTVEKCKSWIESNKSRFAKIKLIQAPHNTGIPSNCNRGLKATHGKWVKLIAGDDILLSNCISINIKGVNFFPVEKFFVSSVYEMMDDTIERILTPPHRILKKSAHEQKKFLLKYSSYLLAPATFFERDALIAVGAFDERYPGFEDYPLYLRITDHGYRFQLLPSPTVIYRVHQESVTRSSNTLFSKSCRKHFEDVVSKMLTKEKMWIWARHFKLNQKLAESNNRDRLTSWVIRITDPIAWIKKIKKKFNNEALTSYDISPCEPIRKVDLIG